MSHAAPCLKLVSTAALAMCFGGCTPPPLEVTKLDVLVGDAVSIKSKATTPLLVRSAVANGNRGNSSCDKAVGKQLQPGETTSLFFVGCGDVMELSVNTDQGTATFKFQKK